MIVKIIWGTSCILYDGFDKVRYKHYGREDAKKKKAQVEWIEPDGWREKRNGDKPGKPVLVLYCRKMSTDDEFSDGIASIKTDCRVYLLNNNGKTIEKIN